MVELSRTYRVGAGDVLDIQLLDRPTTKSTLFTVGEDGLVDYPPAGGALPVRNLTTLEITRLVRERIRSPKSPRVRIRVRDYASHGVVVEGLVAVPGRQFLKLEATPLTAVLAEAQVQPEALRATIARSRQEPIVVDLKDRKASSVFVLSGDKVRVEGRPGVTVRYLYVGGAIHAPGQKIFHAGLTLTQAILASGGLTRTANGKVTLSRPAANGVLTSVEYDLRMIESGKISDPALQPGDRIWVSETSSQRAQFAVERVDCF